MKEATMNKARDIRNIALGAVLTAFGLSALAAVNLTNFRRVDSQAVLERLSKLPITRWNMKGDAKRTPHLGPVAQDFRAAFGLGENDTTINSADAQGVALAAIKGVYERNQALEAQVKPARVATLGTRESVELEMRH
jgi:hypothetical protein